MTRIIAISDTHNQLGKMTLPPGDILIIAGDISNRGKIVEIAQFNEDLGKIKHHYKHIVAISGNHDFLAEEQPTLFRSIITNVSHYLENSATEIDGIKFYGSPVQPTFFNWSFNVDRGAPIKAYWDLIPNDTDILITHGPPHMILDRTTGEHGPAENVGCADLMNAILERPSIKIHAFGHIHSGRGIKEFHNKLFINASSCDEKYRPINPPIVFDFDPTTKEYKLV
jgi:Icc-related predicted phosphoesterase